jgi:hypothetical protein
VIPVNPNTEAQGIARENLATATAAWQNTLTDEGRGSWESYAAATPVTDKLGDTLVLSGQQMFVRNMTRRFIADLLVVTTGPVLAGLGNTPQFTSDPVVDENGQKITIAVTQEGAGGTGALGVYMSLPTSPSKSPAHVRRRFVGKKTPPVAGVFSGDLTDLPFPVEQGQRVRVTVVFFDTDGRVSAEAFRDVIVTDSV